MNFRDVVFNDVEVNPIAAAGLALQVESVHTNRMDSAWVASWTALSDRSRWKGRYVE
jgi:hypothetical protein